MTSQAAAHGSAESVALLVVHGIGRQVAGQTLDGLLGGLCLAYGERLHIRREDAGHAVLDGIGRPVHLFEVYWADLLRGETVKQSFDIERLFEAVWFPLLNHRSGLLPSDRFPRRMVIGWTCVLAPLSALLGAGFWGAKFLAVAPTGVLRAWRGTAPTPAAHAPGATVWDRARAAADDPEVRRTFVDDWMDDFAGDVLNYVQGVAHAFPDDSARTRTLMRKVDAIDARFQQAAQRALAQGCQEIQVLAHSLGTVIAFNAMSPGAAATGAAEGAAQITRFYTIGSPLEKIRFFWTRLVERAHTGPAITVAGRLVAVAAADPADRQQPGLQWVNFFHRLDLVSGQLRPFQGWPPPVNCPARGLGGVMSSHAAYHRNPDFLALLTQGLTGTPAQAAAPPRRRLAAGLRAVLETAALPAIMLGLAAAGLAVFAGAGWATGWVVSQPLEWLGLGAWARGVRIYFAASMVLGGTVLMPLVGLRRAKQLHARWWVQAAGPGAG